MDYFQNKLEGVLLDGFQVLMGTHPIELDKI